MGTILSAVWVLFWILLFEGRILFCTCNCSKMLIFGVLGVVFGASAATPLSALTPLSTPPALPAMATKDQLPVIDCVVTPWQEWTQCTTTCGYGTRERRRIIKLNPENGGKPCPTKLVERRKCKGNPPCLDLSGCRGAPKVIEGLRLGQVTSPGYKDGQEYPTDLKCQYTIAAPYGFRIKLTFAEMDIEASDMCTEDAVEIIEHSNPPRGLGVFCGNETYPPLVTMSNVVSIVFRSNFMIGRGGFRIKYLVTSRPRYCDHLGQMGCKNRNCYDILDRCNGVDNCGDGTDEEGCGFPLKTGDCGLRNISEFYSNDLVVGGKEAVPGSWPWQVSLQAEFIHPSGHMCGGTLINSQWVLTAAHCFMQFRVPEAWRVHLGKHRKFRKDKTEQVRLVERIILYPGTTGYDLVRLPMIDVTNDIALMKLNAPVKFTDQVRPACLPSQGYEIPVGTQCTASGWGTTRGTGSNDVLKEVELTIQPERVCNSSLAGPIYPERMICVKNEQGYQDVCHGDSGGPLVCEIDKRWHVMGATSYGTDGAFEGAGLCGMPGAATVYAKAAYRVKWIHDQINKYS